MVLSTACEGGDLDYKVTVLEDCCADPDLEVHSTLTKKVFLHRGFQVVTSSEYIKTLV